MKLSFSIKFLICFFLIQSASARDYIKVTGSTNLYPIVTLLGEKFGNKYNVKVPVIESTGTGVGFRIFCAGNDDNHPDIVMASREIKDSESALCKKNKVGSLGKVLLGFDGLVLVSSKQTFIDNISDKVLFEAMTGKAKYWNEIDPDLPSKEIQIYGPSSHSGNYETIVERVVKPLCDVNLRCRIRTDGHYVENNANFNILISKIRKKSDIIGIIPYAYFKENEEKIRLVRVDGIEPSAANLVNKKYKLTRELYLYYKTEKKSVRDFIGYTTSLEAKEELRKQGIEKIN